MELLLITLLVAMKIVTSHQSKKRFCNFSQFTGERVIHVHEKQNPSGHIHSGARFPGFLCSVASSLVTG